MSDESSLSDKKITRQTISISPALREAIIEYVHNMQKKHPDDERYNSISAFFTYVMEKALKAFKKGKSLDDLNKMAHKNIRDFFDKITFNAVIPDFENSISLNKYSPPEFDEIPEVFLKSKKLYLEEKGHSKQNIVELYDEFSKYFVSNKITRKSHLELKGDSYSVEYIGKYPNLHFHNVKLLIALLGFLGLKLNKIQYIEKEKYARFKIEPTPLFDKSAPLHRERKTLAQQNIEKLANYFEIVNDEPCHLWIKMATDNNVALKFKNKRAKREWFSKIQRDIENFSPSQKIKINRILKFFENIHWIKILNLQDLVFEFSINQQEWDEEREFLLNKLSEFGEILSREGKYQIKIK